MRRRNALRRLEVTRSDENGGEDGGDGDEEAIETKQDVMMAAIVVFGGDKEKEKNWLWR